MAGMFENCSNLKEIRGINRFITKKVEDMHLMFHKCSELESLDLSNFDTSNVTRMDYMFSECYKLKNIVELNKLNTKKVTDMTAMFQLCYELRSLDLSNFDTANVTKFGHIFSFTIN